LPGNVSLEIFDVSRFPLFTQDLERNMPADVRRRGGVVEVYPVSKTDQGSNYLYSGTVTMFEKAGFKMVAPLGLGRTTTVVVRRTV